MTTGMKTIPRYGFTTSHRNRTSQGCQSTYTWGGERFKCSRDGNHAVHGTTIYGTPFSWETDAETGETDGGADIAQTECNATYFWHGYVRRCEERAPHGVHRMTIGDVVFAWSGDGATPPAPKSYKRILPN